MLTEDNNKKALEALEKIVYIINSVRELFPEISKNTEIKITNKRYAGNYLKILKRIDGIIKNYDKNNAERKIRSLFAFLGITLKRKD